MAAKLYKLTATTVESIKPGKQNRQIPDGGNLYLCVYPSGRKRWRFIKKHKGRLIQCTIGEYPDISLAQARELATKYRVEIETEGRIRSTTPKTFRALAIDWLEYVQAQYTQRNIEIIKRRLERYVFPVVSDCFPNDITPPDWFELLSKIGITKAETARRLRTIISKILRYGIAKGIVERDTTLDVVGLLPTPVPQHFPAPTDEHTLRHILQLVTNYIGMNRSVELALALGPRLFVRPGELVQMRWRDVDLDQGTWTYTMGKVQRPHIVPLSRQVIELLETAPRDSVWVFPSPRSRRHITPAALLVAYRTIGLPQDLIVPHSWRAIARTVLHERLKFDPVVIEAQLGHSLSNPLGRAYWRGELLDERRTMMQTWADYLDSLLQEE